MTSLPVIDLSAATASTELAAQLDRACTEFGFFYLVGHGIDPAGVAALMQLSREFFARPLDEKLDIQMSKGGRAWRGYFPVGGELTSGLPDRKEGIYFGTELGEDDPRVRSGLPLHGRNQFPALPGLRSAVLDYMAALTQLGQRLLRFLARVDWAWKKTSSPRITRPIRSSCFDHLDPNTHVGTYGEYLLGKVGKVFPELRANVLP